MNTQLTVGNHQQMSEIINQIVVLFLCFYFGIDQKFLPVNKKNVSSEQTRKVIDQESADRPCERLFKK